MNYGGFIEIKYKIKDKNFIATQHEKFSRIIFYTNTYMTHDDDDDVLEDYRKEWK